MTKIIYNEDFAANYAIDPAAKAGRWKKNGKNY